MMNLDDLYEYADGHDIDVDWYMLSKAEALSIPLPDGACAIAISPARVTGPLDEKMKMAHELGHCETGAFYARRSPYSIQKKCENRADRWAIQRLIPVEDLKDAVAHGYTEVFDLAEYFSVTEDFMKKAIHYYNSGNLFVE